ncbi:uncharacterized protein LOC118648434 [Monomorium pharaonis]|uniref:uncharacterized protein LOC118648262 n=1 Tax=Monomorium pharaonis TaxID=307658 RepID=UPI0017463141|nr:uncharacterized protein LOC118648262 [Monomorium pharaonis]XP_036150480.1 uncharacterized protein LOC118648262 [Monomorium pharaonis]XP_036150637.1 uncharacterized protein LOC118648434 [Monomorium pharaonis]XP_036150638.1 uncharacterized protein LOC118648434 [Monomorium pharaonis]
MKVLKRVDGTRWSSRHDACDSLCKNWDGVLQSLMIMIEDVHEKAVTRSEAAILKKQLSRFETVFMAVFWNSLLDRFNAMNKLPQSVDIDIGIAVELYRYSLIDFVESLRSDEMFKVYVEKAKCIISEEYEFDSKRSCKRKLQLGESKENEVVMTGRNKFTVGTFYVILDRVRSELEKRHSAYENVFKRFDFMRNLVHLSDTIHEEAAKLYNYYAENLEDSFATECVHFRQFLNKTSSEEKTKLKLIDLCKLIRNQNLLSMFPNIDIALRISLCMATTNCSAE